MVWGGKQEGGQRGPFLDVVGSGDGLVGGGKAEVGVDGEGGQGVWVNRHWDAFDLGAST